MLSKPFWFSNPDLLLSMASKSFTHLLLHHHWQLLCRRDNLMAAVDWANWFLFDSTLLTSKSPFVIQSKYNLHLLQHNRFPLNQHSLFYFLSNLSFILHRNPNLKILIENIWNIKKPIHLLQRFILRILTLHWPLHQLSRRRPPANCGDSSDFNIIFVLYSWRRGYLSDCCVRGNGEHLLWRRLLLHWLRLLLLQSH